MKKKLLYGFVALIAIGAIGSAAGGGKSTGSSSSPVATDEVSQTGDEVRARLGQPVTIDGVEVTILAAETSTGGEVLKPAAGSIWIGYKIRLKAVDGDKYVSSSDWTALSDGDQQGRWTITTEDGWEPLLSLENLRGGATTTGWVVFETPKPTSFVRLIYAPSFFTHEAKLTLDVNVN